MFFRYMRMTANQMEYLLFLVALHIRKLFAYFKESIPAEQQLSRTLNHLATGKSHISLSLQYRVGHLTITKII